MPSRKLYFKTCAASMACAALVWLGFFLCNKNTLPFAVGFLCGAAVAAGTLWLFFKAWRSAPNGGMVALWYALRIVLTVASIGLALAFSSTAALGILLPQLFPIPILALFLALQKD
ncbi:MAG: hypothetical protein RSC58_02535 [Ruthenibacterium sp.]